MMITVDFKNELRIGFDFGNVTKMGTLRVTGINIAGFLPFEFVTDDKKIKIIAEDGTAKIGGDQVIILTEDEDGQAHLAIMIN